MAEFDNKVVLVTGGTSGIGLATAKRYLELGAQVIVTGRTPETNDKARQELGERALVLRSDTADLEQLDALVETVRDRFGKLDVLFANAGVAYFAPIEASDPAFFDSQFNVNIRGAFFAVQKLPPLIPDGGAVLFNTSVVNTKGMPNSSVYAATKGALQSLTRALAIELAPRKIRVNAVSPGPVDTAIMGKTGMTPEQLEGFATQIQAGVPLNRFGNPDEIAQVAVLLTSDRGSFVTGQEFVVDGGFAAT